MHMYRLILLISLTLNVAHASEVRQIEYDFSQVKGAQLSTKARTVQSIPNEYKKVVEGWYSGTVGIEKIFKIASSNNESWITNQWLKNAKDGTELYSIYLVLKTEEIKNKVLRGLGTAKDYFLLERLSSKDSYVKKEFDLLFGSENKYSLEIISKVRQIAMSQKLLQSYNDGYINYDRLVAKSVKNGFLSAILVADATNIAQYKRNQMLNVIYGPKITVIEE